jgi:5-dehydro-2-deoxygluconokinase
MKRFYNLGVYPEWWKLEPLLPAQWHAVDALIAERDPHCRGVLLLGQKASVDALAEGFAAARASGTCRGFAVGRTIFEAPARAWLAGTIDDDGLKRDVRRNYEALIDAWSAAKR